MGPALPGRPRPRVEAQGRAQTRRPPDWDTDCLEGGQARESSVCSPREAFVEADEAGKCQNSRV